MITVDDDDKQSEDYIGGYFDGYVDGYTDGILDPIGPQPEDLDPFLLQMVVASFDTWVIDQT